MLLRNELELRLLVVTSSSLLVSSFLSFCVPCVDWFSFCLAGWRLQGILSVSRALGDRTLKTFLSSLPDVNQLTLLLPHPHFTSITALARSPDFSSNSPPLLLPVAAAAAPNTITTSAEMYTESDSSFPRRDSFPRPPLPPCAAAASAPPFPFTPAALAPPSSTSPLPFSSMTDEFLILATDGLWRVLSEQDAVSLVCQHVQSTHSFANAARVLTEAAITLGSLDNVTALVVDLQTLFGSPPNFVSSSPLPSVSPPAAAASVSAPVHHSSRLPSFRHQHRSSFLHASCT